MLFNIVLVIAAAVAHFALATRRTGFFTVDGVYSSVTLLMALGTLTYVDTNVEADRIYGDIFTIGVVVYYATSAITSQVSSRRQQESISPVRSVRYNRISLLPSGLIVISVLVGMIYFAAVGYNVFLQGLREFGSGAGTNYQDMRIESYSSDQNLNPGYVNQFKNTILPAVSMFSIAALYRYSIPNRKLITVGLVVLNLVMLAGTGQRGALVLALVAAIIFMYHIRQSKSLKWLAPAALGSALPLVFLTYLLGRNAAEVQAADTFPAKAWAVTNNFLERVLRVQQESGISVFRFIYERPIANGTEWVQAVLGVLPGHPGTSLPREAFKWLYGTDRGTATPSVWGSAYYNFGVVGVIVVAVTIGLICQLITLRFYEAEFLTSWDIACYAMFAATFGAWVAGGPEYLLNAGPVTVVLLWMLGRFLPVRDDEAIERVARSNRQNTAESLPVSQGK